MELKVHNFAKIKEANIKLDGITVIAGENNTGKSTIGKILFSMFNSLKDIDGRIETLREEQIGDAIFKWNRSYRIQRIRISSDIVKQFNPSNDILSLIHI